MNRGGRKWERLFVCGDLRNHKLRDQAYAQERKKRKQQKPWIFASEEQKHKLTQAQKRNPSSLKPHTFESCWTCTHKCKTNKGSEKHILYVLIKASWMFYAKDTIWFIQTSITVFSLLDNLNLLIWRTRVGCPWFLGFEQLRMHYPQQTGPLIVD